MPRPLYICGPTASGKSSIALLLAEALGGEVVNADAYQLYRGLEIVTACPTPAEMTRAPHHLYSVVDPSTNLDAARYRELAAPVMAGIRERGRIPIVVGGSGLYLKFLTHGPSPLPPADPAVRRELEELSLEELNRRLAEADPQGAATIDRHNPRYVQRALEVCILTGRPVSELRTSFEKDPPSLRGLLVTWDPAGLDARIRQRTTAMLEGGAIDEVRLLPALSRTASKAIGVPEIRAHLAGDLDRRACEERIAIATRQYAKRQRTWFRREKWLTALPGDASSAEVIDAAQALLDS